MNELKEPFVIYNARKNNAPELEEGYECKIVLNGPEALILEEALERVINNYICIVDSNAKYGDPAHVDIIAQKTEILIPVCARLKKRNEEKDDALLYSFLDLEQKVRETLEREDREIKCSQCPEHEACISGEPLAIPCPARKEQQNEGN